MNTFFTADTHWYHKNIIKYCNRPFSSIEEMNETLINQWNSKISKGDRVYHLGDFAFGQREKILELTKILNGSIIIIEGNHDEIGQPENYGFAGKHQLLTVKINGIYITMCHYAMRVWERSHYNSWHIYGHSHGTLESIGKTWDVGVDNNNFTPVEFEELKKIMESQSHNLNWLERLPGYDQKEYEAYRKIEMS
jgi:calcineurin-like phosphoesterase family protein